MRFYSFFFLLLLLSPQLTKINSLNQDGLYLLQAKNSLSDPTHSLSSWNPRDQTPCNWTGITCDSATHRVNSVSLSSSQLAGPFPIILCRLSYLTSLSLPNNNLNSSLSDDIATCQNLTKLDLAENLLHGSLPGALSRIPNLKSLDLSFNSFTGELPPSWGDFPKLESLSLVSNLLDGLVPSFLGNVLSLKRLELAFNPFAPSLVPSQLGNLTNLDSLWLSGCNFVGPIPPSLGKLSRLTNLELSFNRLTGSIPESFSELKSVIQIELYNNSLSGELRLSFSNLTNLRRFDVSTNRLTGTIPTELCELPLGSLNLMENLFEGTLPESIAQSEYLYELKLFKNKLSGSLPSQLGKNSALTTLDLSYNSFSGQIPESICAKGRLQHLLLIYNAFSGAIPSSLSKCESLLRIRLKHNQFSGWIPQGLWALPHVSLLELSENNFVGNILRTITGAHNLSVLDISKNQFSGLIPGEIGSLEGLVELDASNNNFSGPIPGGLVNLGMLSSLDLSGNELSGEFPQGIKGWKMLNELKLSNNKLSGEIPSEIGSLPVLNYLDLSGNDFSGRIPLELQNLELNALNLSNNHLSGDIPPLYAKEAYKNSFLGNPGLCGDLSGLCPRSGDNNRTLKYLWMLSFIFVLAVVVFIVGVARFYCKYKDFKKTKKGIVISKWRSFHKLGFCELEIADCLKEENVIGSGASGKVYKVELRNHEVVAVKKISGESKKRNVDVEYEKDWFQSEVETLGMIRHKKIVRLWCCCNNGDCKLLVYEYMPNGSLGDMLHGSKSDSLDWPTRYRIALDAADGLSYLHHDCVPPIVHRDVKSNNILLDADFGAKVADFGVAKIVGVGDGAESMSVIAGSYGYIAPEYAYTLRVNEKSDIYSFGVVILELVTGRLPVDPEFGEKDLVNWVRTTIDQKGIDQVIDPKLKNGHMEEIRKVLQIGILCTHLLPISRPSMRRVVNMLQEVSATNESKISSKDGKLSPYYYEDVSD